MSQSLPASDVVTWARRLSPAETRHLRAIVENDAALPKFNDEDPYGPLDEDPPAGLLALIGMVDDPSVPTDYAANSDFYLRDRAQPRHATTA
jgi:hypothetical protein